MIISSGVSLAFVQMYVQENWIDFFDVYSYFACNLESEKFVTSHSLFCL